ncbi:UDP-glucuronate 4-epimerase [Seminavis robusta]|uniref:UDP-glucuronate 4-epimerase n=1 Tax=Seminavis robusta TaxID=568900 RepID=A0A9N8EH94_9STRA|nr:UDP-glucuronate 4-epimerase [Seminavis robusta]|eukprot:Sro1165_g248060.1 UDP-glucuronate 4-epimerase (1191) ;mRNA; r:2466-6038
MTSLKKGNSHGELDPRKQQSTQSAKKQEYNNQSDEKKESDPVSMYAESSSWGKSGNDDSKAAPVSARLSDFDDDDESLDHPVVGTKTSHDVGIPSASGLHHRHHFHAGAKSPLPLPSNVPASPNRRRRGRGAVMGKGVEHPASRKRKWTIMQIVRSTLIAGVVVYLWAMIRGTQILMRDANDDSKNNPKDETTTSILSGGHHLSDLISLPHPAMAGYLRSGETTKSLEDMGPPFVHTPNRDDPNVVQSRVKQRLLERRTRTQQPLKHQQQPIEASSILPYEILTSDRRDKANSMPQQHPASSLANATQLCGQQTQQARQNNPTAFLHSDALKNTDAKVLITGIVSNPLAFHLALTLKAQCGVDVLIGVDPMLPNTIRNRLQHVEQMKLLASNVPKMVHPVLVPLLGLDPRVKKAKKGETTDQPSTLKTTGEINLLNFEPTHIVHLSTATYQNPISQDIEPSPFAPKPPPKPYQVSEDDSTYEPSLFHIRSSLTAMEQIMASLVGDGEAGKKRRPHVTYASATFNRQRWATSSSDDKILSYSKLADEVLADTYNFLFGASSVGVRLPPRSVYGPWSPQDSDLYKLFDRATDGTHTSFDKHINQQEFVYVQDAVEAIITAMQYRSDEASAFELTSNSAASMSSMASMAETFLTKNAADVPAFGLPEQKLQALEWKPRTNLRDGVLKTLAWHIDKTNPYGPPIHDKSVSRPRTGDELLKKHSVSTCSGDDLACHAGTSFLPCASECSVKDQCRPSIFDAVQDLTREMTEGCDAVLYTQSLERDIGDLQLQSQFEDDVEPAICNLAFVAQGSPLVSAVIEKIPQAELVRLGVPATAPEDEKRQKLNGRLLYRGWILIWVDNLVEPLPSYDVSLMKLSPGRMFSKDVMYAVFVEENFTVSPTMDDVRFLISQMDRGATKQRSVYRMIKKDEQSKPAKVRFIVPAQPEKRAAMLVSQLKFKISERGRIPQDTKINILDAVRFMRFEIGSDPTRQKESSEIRRQKDFYRRIPTFVNGKDLRDNNEPLYRYELKHWVRTRWVVHDLTLEDSRQLRCDWYQEHVQWASEVDQLSFSAIMAKRIIERRMIQNEPDDRSKSKAEDIAELKDVTDHNEWFAMASEYTVDHDGDVQPVRDDEGAEDEGGEDGPDISAHAEYSRKKKPDVGLYARVISDRIMSLSRKAWARYRAEMALQAKKRG